LFVFLRYRQVGKKCIQQLSNVILSELTFSLPQTHPLRGFSEP
jgi:hypothetical protein